MHEQANRMQNIFGHVTVNPLWILRSKYFAFDRPKYFRFPVAFAIVFSELGSLPIGISREVAE
jgi:hypothetical protein